MYAYARGGGHEQAYARIKWRNLDVIPYPSPTLIVALFPHTMLHDIILEQQVLQVFFFFFFFL